MRCLTMVSYASLTLSFSHRPNQPAVCWHIGPDDIFWPFRGRLFDLFIRSVGRDTQYLIRIIHETLSIPFQACSVNDKSIQKHRASRWDADARVNSSYCMRGRPKRTTLSMSAEKRPKSIRFIAAPMRAAFRFRQALHSASAAFFCSGVSDVHPRRPNLPINGLNAPALRSSSRSSAASIV